MIKLSKMNNKNNPKVRALIESISLEDISDAEKEEIIKKFLDNEAASALAEAAFNKLFEELEDYVDTHY